MNIPLSWPTEDRTLLCRCLDLAAQAHEGQRRACGAQYISHALATATYVAQLGGSCEMIGAALLHDTLEDTWLPAYRLEQLGKGRRIADLVIAVTSPNYKWSPSGCCFRERWLDATLELGPQAALIKLADRLHNMRTLDALPSKRRRAIGRETLAFFVPLAFANSRPALGLTLDAWARRTLQPALRPKSATTAAGHL